MTYASDADAGNTSYAGFRSIELPLDALSIESKLLSVVNDRKPKAWGTYHLMKYILEFASVNDRSLYRRTFRCKY
jgi:hypothetical protein